MNYVAIFTLIQKGLAALPIIAEAGADAWELITRLEELAKAGAEGTVTEEMLTALEADLDAKLAEFNSPLPEA